MVRLALALSAPLLCSARVWQNRLYSDDMILESREAYDIRPFIAGFGDTPGARQNGSLSLAPHSPGRPNTQITDSLGLRRCAGEKVEVSFFPRDPEAKAHSSHGSYPTTVGPDGKWEVQMNCCDMLVNQTLQVSAQSGNITYKNVACGQVFVCSGQVTPPTLDQSPLFSSASCCCGSRALAARPATEASQVDRTKLILSDI